MIKYLIFSLIVFLIQAENCTFIPVTHIPGTEGIYFERPDEQSNFTLNGFVWGNGNIDYNEGSNLFYSKFLKISDEEFNNTIQTFNCTQYDNYEDVAATGKVDDNLTAEDYQEYLDGKSWLCTIPQGFAAAGVKTILQVSQNQITKLDGYCLLFTVVDDIVEKQYKSLMSAIKNKILKAVNKYDLSSNIYYTNLPRTEASIYQELGNRVAQNKDAQTFTLEDLPNKLPLNMRMFTTFYPPGANILIGRVNLGNPNIVLIFSAQPMTECKKTGHLRQRNSQ